MSTEVAKNSTGISCHLGECPGEILAITEGVVGDGKVVTYECSACRMPYEEKPSGLAKAPQFYREDFAPWRTSGFVYWCWKILYSPRGLYRRIVRQLC